jgi:branched-chain amino acid transport system permease protein
MSEFVQHLVDGVSLGTIYALIALGYTMVYGVLKLINFAHSDIVMVGAFIGYYVSAVRGVRQSAAAPFLVFLAAMIGCALLGFTIERLAYRPLRAQARITSLITAIGISLLLENGGQVFLSPDPRPFPELIANHELLVVAEVPVMFMQILSFGVAVALMLGLQFVVFRTRFGMAMRAVSFDPNTASLMGINVDRVISGTFMLGSSLAAAAGVLFALTYERIEPMMGLIPGLKAFVAAVLGGIGNVPGAMAGGLLMGLSEEFVAGYLSSSYRDAVAFGILIVILLIRPSGLFGRVVAEKV